MMKLREKIYYAIAAGWASLLLGYGCYKSVNAKNNHAGIIFMENGKMSSDNFSTKDPCSVTLKAYGYDADGISNFELKLDGETYLSSPINRNIEYSFMAGLCGLRPGAYRLEAIITDNNGEIETGEGLLTVEGHIDYI